MHFGLATFPHAPALHTQLKYNSLLPLFFGLLPFHWPTPSAGGKDRPTSCSPLTLTYPRLFLAGLQTRPMTLDAKRQNTWQSSQARERERGLCARLLGEVFSSMCEWDSLLPCGGRSSRFPKGVWVLVNKMCALCSACGGRVRAEVLH